MKKCIQLFHHICIYKYILNKGCYMQMISYVSLLALELCFYIGMTDRTQPNP